MTREFYDRKWPLFEKSGAKLLFVWANGGDISTA
jgi:hypothetical protein